MKRLQRLALCVAMASMLAACGGGGTGSSDASNTTAATSAPSTSGASVTRTASDRGVTPTTVKIALIAPDLTKLLSLPMILAADDIANTVAGLSDVINAEAINGRTVELQLYQWDPLKLPDSMDALCLQIAQDDEIFAALALAYYGDAVTCLTGTNGVPLYVLGSQPQSLVDTSNGNVFVEGFIQDDLLAQTLPLFADAGVLDGRTIGYVATDEPGQDAIQAKFTDALEGAGFSLKAGVQVENPSIGTNPTIAAAAKNLRDAGVDAVFAGGNSVLMFSLMAEAELIGWHPRWLLTDLSEQSSLVVVNNAPGAQLESVVALSAGRQNYAAAGLEPSEQDQECLEIRNGVEGAPALAPDGLTVSGGFLRLCAMAKIFRRALEGAGPEPTRASFVAAFHDLGPVELGTGGAGSFGPSKIAGIDEVRFATYLPDCSGTENGCFVPDGDWLALR